VKDRAGNPSLSHSLSHTRSQTHTHAHTHTHTHTLTHTQTHTRTHIQTHTHTNTHTHTPHLNAPPRNNAAHSEVIWEARRRERPGGQAQPQPLAHHGPDGPHFGRGHSPLSLYLSLSITHLLMDLTSAEFTLSLFIAHTHSRTHTLSLPLSRSSCVFESD